MTKYTKRIPESSKKVQQNCLHGRKKTEYVPEIDNDTGRDDGRWETTFESYDEDINLHKFQCQECGRIGNYCGGGVIPKNKGF